MKPFPAMDDAELVEQLIARYLDYRSRQRMTSLQKTDGEAAMLMITALVRILGGGDRLRAVEAAMELANDRETVEDFVEDSINPVLTRESFASFVAQNKDAVRRALEFVEGKRLFP